MQIHVNRLQFLVVLMASAFLLTGCQTTGKHVRSYDGPPAETNAIALLKVQRSIWTVVLTVDAIDGRPLTKGKFIGNDTSEIELLPGQHDLEVSYRDGNGYRSTTDTKIRFEAEIGKSYEMLGAPLERSFAKATGQALTFQHWHWTLWIVDAESKNVVAGTPRTTPLHWYEK